jgi:hypothetical protein
MRTRSGFARLLPLMAFAGVAAGTIALLTSARPTKRRSPAGPSAAARAGEPGVGYNIVDYYGRIWQLHEIPGHKVRWLILPNAQWHGVDLHGATLIDCDFKGADLRGADLRDARLADCELERADLSGADLTGSDLSGTTFDDRTRWPEGFDPAGRGAQIAYWER